MDDPSPCQHSFQENQDEGQGKDEVGEVEGDGAQLVDALVVDEEFEQLRIGFDKTTARIRHRILILDIWKKPLISNTRNSNLEKFNLK